VTRRLVPTRPPLSARWPAPDKFTQRRRNGRGRGTGTRRRVPKRPPLGARRRRQLYSRQAAKPQRGEAGRGMGTRRPVPRRPPLSARWPAPDSSHAEAQRRRDGRGRGTGTRRRVRDARGSAPDRLVNFTLAKPPSRKGGRARPRDGGSPPGSVTPTAVRSLAGAGQKFHAEAQRRRDGHGRGTVTRRRVPSRPPARRALAGVNFSHAKTQRRKGTGPDSRRPHTTSSRDLRRSRALGELTLASDRHTWASRRPDAPNPLGGFAPLREPMGQPTRPEQTSRRSPSGVATATPRRAAVPTPLCGSATLRETNRQPPNQWRSPPPGEPPSRRPQTSWRLRALARAK